MPSTCVNQGPAHRLCSATKFDCIVTDLRMPGLDGIGLTEALRLRWGDIRVLVLTTFREDPDVQRALHAGADGYLLKSAAPRDLAEAVRRLAAGDTWLDPAVAGSVVAALRSTPRPAVTAPSALAGRTDTLFSDDAVELIHQVSRGLPRAVNNLAGQALIAAYAGGRNIVDESSTRTAVTEVTAE